MRFKYFVYPDAVEKINSTGLAERIEKLRKSEEGLGYIGGHLDDGDVVNGVNNLKENGYFKTFPKKEISFQKSMNRAINDRDNSFWEVHKNDGIVREKLEAEDLELMVGVISSYILTPEEIWDYERFGFSNISDFTGSLGAVIREASHGRDFGEGYVWETTLQDGRILKNQITGDMHCDLRIFQTDKTAYKTIDPLGNSVSYRPQLDSDRSIVAGYHSTEGSLLVSILKYIEQQKIHSELLKNNGKELIEWAKSLGQRGGMVAEHFFPSDRLGGERLQFLYFDFPIPVLDDNYKTEQRTLDGVFISSENSYRIYVSPKKELVFSRCNKKEKQKVISASFQPEEADHLLKGLFYQCAMGLGRTSAAELIGLLEYKYSEKFEKDVEENSKL